MNQYHTFWRRLFSGLVDSIIFLPIEYADHFLDLSNKYVHISWLIITIVSWMVYSVYLHGKYGQTIGKRLLKVKVLDISETTVIGYKRAFLRDSLGVVFYTFAIIYLLILVKGESISEAVQQHFDLVIGNVALVWLLLEVFTMLLNSKRRSIDDFIANSVVIKE